MSGYHILMVATLLLLVALLAVVIWALLTRNRDGAPGVDGAGSQTQGGAGWRSALFGLVGAVLLLAIVVGVLPLGIALLKHWHTDLPENTLTVVLITGTVAFLLSLALLVVVFQQLNLADSRFALGLPEGSIRAVIALLLILLFFILSVFLYSQTRQGANTTVLDPVPRATVNSIPAADLIVVRPSTINKTMFHVERAVDTSASNDLAKQLLTTLSTLIVAVAAFYFGANSVQAAARSAAASAGQQMSADALLAKVKAAFSGDAFANVTPSVAGSSVTLAGTVVDQAFRDQAERTVRALSGVTDVVNNLTVTQPTDDELLGAANSALGGAGISGVTVTVSAGVVTLAGEVADQATSDSAGQVVAAIAGVVSVTNNVTLPRRRRGTTEGKS
jgi:osmotically-inducible protein OsmY